MPLGRSAALALARRMVSCKCKYMGGPAHSSSHQRSIKRTFHCSRALGKAARPPQCSMAFITAVKLKAFKSVGGDWLEVHFDRGLNAVVGALLARPTFGVLSERDREAGAHSVASEDARRCGRGAASASPLLAAGAGRRRLRAAPAPPLSIHSPPPAPRVCRPQRLRQVIPAGCAVLCVCSAPQVLQRGLAGRPGQQRQQRGAAGAVRPGAAFQLCGLCPP